MSGEQIPMSEDTTDLKPMARGPLYIHNGTYYTGPEVCALKEIGGIVIDTTKVLVVVDHPKNGVSVYLTGLDKPVYIEGLTVSEFLEAIK